MRVLRHRGSVVANGEVSRAAARKGGTADPSASRQDDSAWRGSRSLNCDPGPIEDNLEVSTCRHDGAFDKIQGPRCWSLSRAFSQPREKSRLVHGFFVPALHVLHGLGEVGEAGFGVAVEHGGAGLEEEGILES